MQSSECFKINIHELSFIQFILEGYEGLATVTTINKNKGLIRVLFNVDFRNDVNEIIRHLKNDFYIADLNDD
ncbi:MAG: DUF4911 domain-containing protein [Syntrophaceae bacterium]|nr:DUF4911 domain-containing protein [Syntrophaceae bacterium]